LGLKDPALAITYSVSVSEPGTTITAIPLSDFKTVPGSVRIGGTAGAGQVVTVFLATTPYSYTTVAGDTLETIVTRLAAQVNNDPNVSATADLPNLTIQLALKTPNLSIPFSAIVRRAGALRASTAGGLAPTSVTVSGTPRPGEGVRVSLGTTIYAYMAVAGDTAATMVSRLAERINADPNVSARADLDNLAIVLEVRSEGATIPVSAAVSPVASFTAIPAFQYFTPGVANAENDVSARLGEALPLVPGQIVLAGTADPGQTITVSLLETRYSYTTVAGDTLQSVLTNLASVISGDPNVTATADVTNSLINLQVRNPSQGATITFSVSLSPGATLSALTASAQLSEALPASVSFAGLVKGTVGLYQVNFQVPESAPAKPDTKLTLSQNLIIFGSVSNFDIFSNTVTFPVADPPAQ
jgi:phage tail sheath gpL-like